MWRTAQKLQNCPRDDTLTFPAAYRDWIESVYSEDAWGTEPAEIEAGFEKYQDVLLEKRGLARQMLRWADDVALPDNDDDIRAVTRDGEFNLGVVPYLETLAGKQLLDGSVYEPLTEWQQAEALAMNTVSVPQSWGKFLPKPDDEQRIWLAMQQDQDSWKDCSKEVWFTYHPVWGMEKESST